ncbi:hypothetical protein BH18ACT15_BH18ACT15_03850 [soil metagenome]
MATFEPTRSAGAPQPFDEASAIVLVIDGPIARADLPGMCARMGELVANCDAQIIVCDVGRLVDPDAVTVDALARLQLTARRLRRRIRLRRASPELKGLLALAGLSTVVPLGGDPCLRPKGQS